MSDSTITVSTDLRNDREIVLHAQFLGALLAGRANSGAGFVPPAASPAAQQTQKINEQYGGLKLVKEEAPAAPAAPALDPKVVEAAFLRWVSRPDIGSPTARKLLDSYGAARLGDVPPDRLPAFYAEITR